VNILDEDHRTLLQHSVEPDVRILSTRYHRVAGILFLIEIWNWEGIRGHSAVFLNQHVARMDDGELQRFLTNGGVDLGGSVTIVRKEEYTFVNFGFEDKGGDHTGFVSTPIR
jgi:hypothetical protein